MNKRELNPQARPTWVMWLVAAVAVLVVIALAMMLFGPGQHGPGRHM